MNFNFNHGCVVLLLPIRTAQSVFCWSYVAWCVLVTSDLVTLLKVVANEMPTHAICLSMLGHLQMCGIAFRVGGVSFDAQRCWEVCWWGGVVWGCPEASLVCARCAQELKGQ